MYVCCDISQPVIRLLIQLLCSITVNSIITGNNISVEYSIIKFDTTSTTTTVYLLYLCVFVVLLCVFVVLCVY